MITNYLPVFEGNQKLFQEVIFKVANHARECYGMKSYNQPIKRKDKVNQYFE